MTNTKRIISQEELEEDIIIPLRPEKLGDFTGQPHLKENLTVFIESTKKRKEAIDHILLHGPPGLGKTTLAHIVSNELGVGFRSTAAPMITKAGDLAAILTNLESKDVLFIDEIHRLSSAVEEILYSAMEDYKLDIIIGEGPSARSVKIDLPPFTLIGATTRTGLLTSPLRDRFGIPLRLNFYAPEDLNKIITRAATLLNTKITEEGSLEIAKRSRGTPRIAIRLLKRVRDFADYENAKEITKEIADLALKKLFVDHEGLDEMDRKYLNCIIENYKGGPVGIETIAAALSEEIDTLDEIIEPYLLQKGFLQRTPRGRIISEKAYNHLGIKPIKNNPNSKELF
jgi:Holliday junction DNA helicase RuvB